MNIFYSRKNFCQKCTSLNVPLLLRSIKVSKTLQFFVSSTICAIKNSYTNQHVFYFRATQYYRTYSQTNLVEKFGNIFYNINCNISNIVVVVLPNHCITTKRLYGRHYCGVYFKHLVIIFISTVSCKRF